MGNIAYDGPQQGFTSIDAIPRILYNQAPEGPPTDMTVDTEGGATSMKRGAEGDVRTPLPPPSGGDGGWNIFRNTIPYLVHDGVRVSPPRYYLDLAFPEAPTGASTILDTILRGCELEPPKEEDTRASEEPPSKKGRQPRDTETAQLAVTGATTTSEDAGFALVQACTAVSSTPSL